MLPQTRIPSLLILFFSFTLYAAEINFSKVKDVNLLSEQTIWSMAYDNDGYLWIGGNFGLLYYDGYKLKDVRNKIPSANILKTRKIFLSKSGSLWIGTKGYGLFEISKNSIQHFEINSDIKDIIESKEGVWVASYEALILIKKDNRVEKYFYSEKPYSQNIQITALAELNTQELIVGTQKNVFKFNRESQVFSEIHIEGLKGTYINSLYKDFNNTLWMATDIGVFVKPIHSDVFEPYHKDLINFRVNTLLVDEKNTWMGSVTKGLIKISHNDESIVFFKNELQKRPSISGNIITAMLLNNGVIFVSTFYGGLNYFDTKASNFGLISNENTGIFCSKSHIFYGFEVDENGSTWISSDSGFIEYWRIWDRHTIKA